MFIRSSTRSIVAPLAFSSMYVASKGQKLLVRSGLLKGRAGLFPHFSRAFSTANKVDSDCLLPPRDIRCYNQIPFVNRDAEVFDVVVKNLIDCVELDPLAQRRVALATQAEGMGKSLLGANLVRALNRPRESPQQAARVAERLLTARSLWHRAGEEIVENALNDPRDESLTVRAVRALLKRSSPWKGERVDKLVDDFKRARTVVVSIQGLETKYDTLGDALGAAIAEQTLTDPAIASFKGLARNASSMCKLLVEQLLDGPLFIVLDDIDELVDGQKLLNLASHREGIEESAMKMLSKELQRMLLVPGVRIYCTGRMDSISLPALTGSVSPLVPFHIILHPLSVEDIEEMFALAAAQQTSLCNLDMSRIATDPKVIRALSEKLVDFSGGNGHAVEYALQFLHKQSLSRLSSVDAVTSAVEGACNYAQGRMDHMTTHPHDFSSLITPETSELIRQHLVDSSLLFNDNMEVETPSKTLFCGITVPKKMFFTDALSVLGFSYTAEGPGKLRATTGKLQLSLLPDTVPWKNELLLMHAAKDQKDAGAGEQVARKKVKRAK